MGASPFNKQLENRPSSVQRLLARLISFYPLVLISLVPIAMTSFIWIEVIRGVASRAIDGSGHYAIAQVYDESIFPETFGWTNAYFGGMSFPNFYPPLFFWIVSLIHHSHLLSFATSFKLIVGFPLVIMPAVFWAIAWTHAGRDKIVAYSAAIASATLYSTGEVFQPNTGLDMSSTLLDGFYTQPLGFLLLLLWILIYLLPRQKPWQFGLGSILLALTVLANFFNAITAILLIASVLLSDIVSWFRTSDPLVKQELKKSFFNHLLSPFIALTLTAFWVVPMLSTYQYLVTRPVVKPLDQLMTVPISCWYLLAAVGIGIWLRNPVGRIGPYLIACLILLVGLIFAGAFAPSWFPLQVFRFFATLNFLFCVPVGISIAYAVKLYLQKRKGWSTKGTTGNEAGASDATRSLVLFGIALVGLIALAVAMSTKKLTEATAFYTADNYERIRGPLEFAEQHKDGRYLVEVLPSKALTGLVRSDSLALNAYLGSQGNETISIVYREASPNSSFFNAELNAFSDYRENFGISSALIDDLDFINQPLAQHIKRLQFIGVRYLIIGSPEMKKRLASEPEVGEQHNLGDWTIFTLKRPALPNVRTLSYKPALFVGDFTVKQRRQNQIDFIRLAEEQFNDAWFDVLLVRSPERKIDKIRDLDQFGALILTTYEYDDASQAFSLLKEFAQRKPVIFFESDHPIFARLSSAELPHLRIISRPKTPGSLIDSQEPTSHYNSSPVRTAWQELKAGLDQEKISVDHPETSTQPQTGGETKSLRVPLLIMQTYHPRWVREDGGLLYAATPFVTLTFNNSEPRMTFRRTTYDKLSLWVSGISLLAVCLYTGIGFVYRRS